MAVVRWIGAAPAIKQVDVATVGGTIEVGDLFWLRIGTKTIYVPALTTVVATTAQNIADYWAALDRGSYPEFTGIKAQANGVYVTFEASEAGKPFTITVGTKEANGDASDSQTFTIAASVVNSSPHAIGVAANYAGATLPTTGDTLVVDTDSPNMLWDLEALAAVQLAELVFTAPVTELGLPDQDRDGYPQYRPKYFKCRATLTTILTGSALIRLDYQTFASTVVINGTGSSREQQRKAVCIQGSNAANAIRINKGSVGIAMMQDETARFDDVRIGYVTNVAGDANVECGRSCTLSAVIKNGGQLRSRSSVASGINRGGTWTVDAGSCVLLTVEAGDVIYNSIDAIGTPTLTGTGILDFSRDPSVKTVTNPIELFGTAVKFRDPANTGNAGSSLIFDFNQGASLANLELGNNIRITRSTPA